ncbi:glycosyltransferase [Halomonas sp. KO116]|uniref:glycosyltransferase n=1 Tax=Halomonas sp. KO116 TaxID=1504981 RepID=UPI0004E30B8B|nr:glycosyltransferase family A protein [Halomonas sp. KO116]AJY50072.1 glycosyl transferase family 2 [Halomonas sp. KO116]
MENRVGYYGNDQVITLNDYKALTNEKRDTFVVIKFMDESPHIRATLKSILNQKYEMERLVVVAVDNNSTDGSDEIVKSVINETVTDARIYYVNQFMPGGGNAARYGVDACISTIYNMCKLDNDWSRLQHCSIAVTDGDTVYTEGVLKEIDFQLKSNIDIDGVMPFLIYKITSTVRFFNNYVPLSEDFSNLDQSLFIKVDFPLCGSLAYEELKLSNRIKYFNTIFSRDDFAVHTNEKLSYIVLIDKEGNKAKLYIDGQLLLEQSTVSGDDRSLVYLNNNYIERNEKWKWHTLVGHDIFLRSLYTMFSFPEEAILPDTSDALKTFRCWSFSIGGQHQLSRPGLKIVTGTDYQSGRIHKAVGCRIVLANAEEYSETEIDRLAKMIRNFNKNQNIFYGDARSSSLERASGLYLHMTRIQTKIEEEVKKYDDNFYKETAFPERILFPLRWVLKNSILFSILSSQSISEEIEKLVFLPLLGLKNLNEIKKNILNHSCQKEIISSEHEAREEKAEKIAEKMIEMSFDHIMFFYKKVLGEYFKFSGVDSDAYKWLLEDVGDIECALLKGKIAIDPAEAWRSEEYVIDQDRGQVVDIFTSRGSENEH